MQSPAAWPGFVLFCLISSVVYIINDIVDVEADRQHPIKRNRPIASGKLPVPMAAIIAVVFLVLTLPRPTGCHSAFSSSPALYF